MNSCCRCLAGEAQVFQVQGGAQLICLLKVAILLAPAQVAPRPEQVHPAAKQVALLMLGDTAGVGGRLLAAVQAKATHILAEEEDGCAGPMQHLAAAARAALGPAVVQLQVGRECSKGSAPASHAWHRCSGLLHPQMRATNATCCRLCHSCREMPCRRC